MKLSAARRDLLQRLANGDLMVLFLDSPKTPRLYHNGEVDWYRRFSWRMFQDLIRVGYLEKKSPAISYEVYAISDAGRAALSAQENK
jgi:hypothetical protein